MVIDNAVSICMYVCMYDDSVGGGAGVRGQGGHGVDILRVVSILHPAAQEEEVHMLVCMYDRMECMYVCM